jgi:class 3 adenylate cyclase
MIFHPRLHPYFGPEHAQRAAAAIPGARLALVDSSTVLFMDNRVASIAAEFLGMAPAVRSEATSARSGTAVILFADIADSTALTERLGDAAFREKARALDDALRATVRANGGAVIDAKTLGDGILATFPAASQAIAAGLACAAAGDGAGLPLHVGLHAGDVIRESDNVFGGAVNIAARISSLAAPGEVLVSRTVADLGRTSARVAFEDRGEHALKGVAEPQRVFAVRTDSL